MALHNIPVANAMSGRVLVDAYSRAPQILFGNGVDPPGPLLPSKKGRLPRVKAALSRKVTCLIECC